MVVFLERKAQIDRIKRDMEDLLQNYLVQSSYQNNFN